MPYSDRHAGVDSGNADLLFGWFLTPMRPMKMADRGGIAPYWLGTAQLKAGGSCQVGS